MSDKNAINTSGCVNCFGSNMTVEQMKICCAKRQEELGVDKHKPSSC